MSDEVKAKEEFTPLADRIFCEMIINDDDKAIGGIIIPDSAQNKPRKALVISVGDGTMTPEGKIIPLRVKAGDKVILDQFGGTDLKINDIDYKLVVERDCLGIIG